MKEVYFQTDKPWRLRFEIKEYEGYDPTRVEPAHFTLGARDVPGHVLDAILEVIEVGKVPYPYSAAAFVIAAAVEVVRCRMVWQGSEGDDIDMEVVHVWAAEFVGLLFDALDRAQGCSQNNVIARQHKPAAE